MRALRSVRVKSADRQRASIAKVSPHEKFSGTKLDFKRDLRCQFGDRLECTVPNTNNTMEPRTDSCIAMGSAGNLTGSIKVWNIDTGTVFIRDQFTILPHSQHDIQRISAIALSEGLTRSAADDTYPLASESSPPVDGPVAEAPVEREAVRQPDNTPAVAVDAGVEPLYPENTDYGELRRSSRTTQGQPAPRFADSSFHVSEALTAAADDEARSALHQCLLHRANFYDQQLAFKMSV